MCTSIYKYMYAHITLYKTMYKNIYLYTYILRIKWKHDNIEQHNFFSFSKENIFCDETVNNQVQL